MDRRELNRRELLQRAALLGGAATLAPTVPAWGARPPWERRPPKIAGGSILDLPAAQAPIDTVLVIMMENRSFDHYLGWLATDEAYREEGRSRYRHFRVDADNTQQFPAPNGSVVPTFHLLSDPSESNPYRGCGHGDPGHGWNAGRAQRDGGFLAPGSGNDEFALGYYRQGDLPFYEALTRRFTVFDRYHCSLLGPTFPNREYLHSAQSGGQKTNALPPEVGFPNGFTWPTIWDRLLAANVPCGYYYVDLPTTFLWGTRLVPISKPVAQYFAAAAAGTLPNVTFVDPGFVGGTRSDEHPHGDVRDGQSFVRNAIKAFVESPHWEHGLIILTYDEWGGFFDHARPPIFQDDRGSNVDQENFGQAGFRVPARLLSPYARQNFVDHRLYDHTSILRFLEWRFLGAPPHGAGTPGSNWWLTLRDRTALNIGWSLKPDDPDPEFDVSGPPDPPGTHSTPCVGQTLVAQETRVAPPAEPSPYQLALDTGTFERMGYRIDLRPLPVV